MIHGVRASFGFVDVRGRLQVAGRVRSLVKLEDRGLVALPAPTNSYATGIDRRLLPAPALPACPNTVQDARNLTLARVTDRGLRAVWNTLCNRSVDYIKSRPCGHLMF